MDKPLFPNDKNTILDQNEAKKLSLPGNAPDLSAQNNTTIGAYSPNSSKPIELSQKAWNESVNDPKTGVPWMNDWKSRMGVRAFSRGIMGAGFFVVGGMLSRKWMKGYDLTKTFGEQENKNALQFLAKSIDTVVGKPIEAIIKTVTGNERRAKRAVLFRSTYYTNKLQVGGKTLWGRSLGQEVIDVTFDFFSASVGDALGRDLISGLDPNVKKDWIDDKGHVDVKKAAGHAGKAVWRYLTYNGGEDWAVAIPYVYFMKWQRQYINNFSPGWKYDFDQDKKGGSFKLGGSPRKLDGTVDHHHMPTVTGNYALEGIVDFQNRFTVYNIGTLMYREMYDYIGNRLHGKTDHLYGDPSRPDQPEHAKTGLLSKFGETAKWAARSAIKGVIIMTPTVPFFWLTRTNQHKHRGLFVHPEHGMMTRRKQDASGKNYNQPVAVSDYHYFSKDSLALAKEDVYYSEFDRKVSPGHGIPYKRVGPMDPAYANPAMWMDPTDLSKAGLHGTNFHPYHEGRGISDRAFNAIGRGQYKVTKLLTKPAVWADTHLGGFGEGIKKGLGGFPPDQNGKTGSFTYFTGPFARAAMSYTPYMYAKAEFANLWDNGKTDMAAERLIDGATKLNWGEFKAGAGEVWNAILHKPMDDPDREVEAEHRVEVRNYAPEILTHTQFTEQRHLDVEKIHRQEKNALQVKRLENERGIHAPTSSWQERVIQGRPEDKPEVGANKPKSYAEQEAMRKALEEMHPPTNAIN